MRSNFFKYLLIVPLFSFCSDGNSQNNSIVFANQDKIEQLVKLPPVPNKLSFASEEVPMSYFDVRESILKELTMITYWHSSLVQIILLDSRYSATVKKILKEEGVHQDFYFLCLAESGLQPVVSSVGASGYWQFLEGTAKDFGLIVNEEVDERYNLEKSTRAACAYFKKAFGEFGTWTMAAASYNIGMSNVKYRMNIQSQKNYYDTQFPEETARYLFRALAFKAILSDPAKYGFYLKKEELYKELEYREITVDYTVKNWSEFAAKYNTNFKLLKMFNPWIRANNMLNRDKNCFVVKVPKEGYRDKK